MQIIILGTHRSGTSLTTRLINMMGAYIGGEQTSLGFNLHNPKGFWERRDVVVLNDDIMVSWNALWDEVSGTENKERVLTEEFAGKIQSIILEMDAHRPWVMKDPRLCITFPEWRQFLEMPVVVIATRNPLETAFSHQQRDGFSLHHGLAIWEYYMVSALNSTRGLPVIFTDYASVLADPVAATRRLYEELLAQHVQGIRMPADKEILAFIEPSLYHSKIAIPLTEILSEKQLKLLPYTTGEKTVTEPLTVSEGARDIMHYYGQQQHAQKEQQQWQEQLTTTDRSLQELTTKYGQLERQETELRDAHQLLAQEMTEVIAANQFLNAALDQCLLLGKTASWRLATQIMRVLHVVLFRFAGTDKLSDITKDVEKFRSREKERRDV